LSPVLAAPASPLSAVASSPLPQTPKIQVSPPESPEDEQPDLKAVQRRAQLTQRILSLPSKRNQAEQSADNLLSRHTFLLPSLEAIAAKYQEKLNLSVEEPRSPKRKLDEPSSLRPLKSPKSPKRGKNLRELLERRTAVKSA
jgi:hypothetical protein